MQLEHPARLTVQHALLLVPTIQSAAGEFQGECRVLLVRSRLWDSSREVSRAYSGQGLLILFNRKYRCCY